MSPLLVIALFLLAGPDTADLPLLARDPQTAPPLTPDPSKGCAAPGETLKKCVDSKVSLPELPATTVRACEVTGGTRVAIVQEKKILTCVVMTDLERAPDGQLYRLHPKFASTGLIVFKHTGYRSDADRLEIIQVGKGVAQPVFRGRWFNLTRFEDLDGDAVPELLGTETNSQNLYCDYIPLAVFALKAGRYVRDDAAMERWAKANKVAWWGPEPLIDGTNASHPYMIDCHQKKKRLSE